MGPAKPLGYCGLSELLDFNGRPEVELGYRCGRPAAPLCPTATCSGGPLVLLVHHLG